MEKVDTSSDNVVESTKSLSQKSLKKRAVYYSSRLAILQGLGKP